MVMMTLAQMQKQKKEEIHCKEVKSGAKTKKVEEWMQTFDDDIFEGGHNKVKQTRSPKRQQRRAHAQEIAQDDMLDTDQSHVTALHPLDISAGELKVLQAADTTLDAVRREADENSGATGAGYFWKDGLLFRKWISQGQDEQDMTNEQLILPMQCRNMVLQLAHDITLSGHLGKKKTTKRILQRFYWPTIHCDVAEYCRTCEVCQKVSRHKVRRAPMIPLPIVEEPDSHGHCWSIAQKPFRKKVHTHHLRLCNPISRGNCTKIYRC